MYILQRIKLIMNPDSIQVLLEKDGETGKFGVSIFHIHKDTKKPEKVWSLAPCTIYKEEIIRMVKAQFDLLLWYAHETFCNTRSWLYKEYNMEGGYEEAMEQVPYKEFKDKMDSGELFKTVPFEAKILDEDKVSSLIFDLEAQFNKPEEKVASSESCSEDSFAEVSCSKDEVLLLPNA